MEISPLATPTSKNPIRLLERESSDIIRACTILPEFCSFVEELVLNSIKSKQYSDYFGLQKLLGCRLQMHYMVHLMAAGEKRLLR